MRRISSLICSASACSSSLAERRGTAARHRRTNRQPGRGAQDLRDARRCLARTGDGRSEADGRQRSRSPRPSASVPSSAARSGSSKAAATTTPARSASMPSASSRSTRRRTPTRCTRTPKATSATSPSSPTGDGYRWEIPIGPARLRYVATVKDGELHEIGERIVAGRRAAEGVRDAAQADRRHRLAGRRRGQPQIAHRTMEKGRRWAPLVFCFGRRPAISVSAGAVVSSLRLAHGTSKVLVEAGNLARAPNQGTRAFPVHRGLSEAADRQPAQ